MKITLFPFVIPGRAKREPGNPEVSQSRFSDVQLHIIVRRFARPGMTASKR
jgi:hypothetical protein